MGLMRRFGRRVKRWMSKGLTVLLDKLYDGPTPPDRLPGFLFEFMVLYPHANRHEWSKFAYRLGEELYKSGFQRGFTRGLEEGRQLPPAEEEGFAWRWGMDHPSTEEMHMLGSNRRVPEEDSMLPRNMTAEEQARYYQWRLHDELTRIHKPGRL